MRQCFSKKNIITFFWYSACHVAQVLPCFWRVFFLHDSYFHSNSFILRIIFMPVHLFIKVHKAELDSQSRKSNTRFITVVYLASWMTLSTCELKLVKLWTKNQEPVNSNARFYRKNVFLGYLTYESHRLWNKEKKHWPEFINIRSAFTKFW